jgi:RHS repeat-associated protein
MELDNEVKGNGNSYTTEFRQYDPRLGRWLSLDPLMSMFPDMSPYVAFDNNPILFIDPYGLASGTGGPNEGGGAGDKNKIKVLPYEIKENSWGQEDESHLPSKGIEKDFTIILNFPKPDGGWKKGDHRSISYQSTGKDGVWKRWDNYCGKSEEGAIITSAGGNVGDFDHYMNDGNKGNSTIAGTGGLGGTTGKPSNVTNKPNLSTSSTPETSNMGANTTTNSPTGKTNAVLNDKADIVLAPLSVTSKVFENAIVHADDIDPDGPSLTKASKAIKVIDDVAKGADIVTGVVDAVIHYNEGHTGKAMTSLAKVGANIAAEWMIKIGAAAIRGSYGGPAGMIFSIGTTIAWEIISNNW